MLIGFVLPHDIVRVVIDVLNLDAQIMDFYGFLNVILVSLSDNVCYCEQKSSRVHIGRFLWYNPKNPIKPKLHRDEPRNLIIPFLRHFALSLFLSLKLLFYRMLLSLVSQGAENCQAEHVRKHTAL